MKSLAQIGQIPVKEEFIGYGDNAITNTAYKMKDIITNSSKNPYIRQWAQYILGQVEVNNKRGEVEAIHNFVRDHVRYTKDPYGFEYIQTPPVLLEDIRLNDSGQGERPVGDCDDMTVLSLSLMKSVGFPVALKIVSYRPDGKFGHVYGLVKLLGEWVPTDTVRSDKELGWESQGITRVMEVEI